MTQNAQSWRGGTALLILNLSARRRWVVKATAQPLNLRDPL